MKPYFKYLFLIASAVCLSACPAGLYGDVGHLENPLLHLEQVVQGPTQDHIFYKTHEGWVETSLDKRFNRTLFKPNFEILDGTYNGHTLILKNASNDELFIYNHRTESLTPIPRPPSGFPYDHAALSPDGLTVAATASARRLIKEAFNSPWAYTDDSIYIIDAQTLQTRAFHPYYDKGQVTHLYWDKAGKVIINKTVACTYGENSNVKCKKALLKRDVPTRTLTVIKEEEDQDYNIDQILKTMEGHLQIPLFISKIQDQERKECQGRTLHEIRIDQHVKDSKYDVAIQIEKRNKERMTLVKVTGRQESGGDTRPIPPLHPQFTSDCRFVLFSLDKDLFIADAQGRGIAFFDTRISQYISPYIFPQVKYERY